MDTSLELEAQRRALSTAKFLLCEMELCLILETLMSGKKVQVALLRRLVPHLMWDMVLCLTMAIAGERGLQ